MRWIAWEALANALCDTAESGDRAAYTRLRDEIQSKHPGAAETAIHRAKLQIRMMSDHRLFSWRSDYLRKRQLQ